MTTTTITSTSGTGRSVTIDDHDNSKRVYLILRDPNQDRFLANINVNTEDLVDAINKIPGVTATYEKPKPPLPTEPGIYISRANTGYSMPSASVFKLKREGYWTDGNGKDANMDQLERIMRISGLVRLVPDE